MEKLKFIVRRLLLAIPMLLVVTVMAFILSHMSSGNIAAVTIQKEGGVVTEQTIAAKEVELGLDQPLHIQYLRWLEKAVHLDFGISFISKEPVTYEILSRFPATLALAAAATCIAILIGLAAAILSVIFHGKAVDFLIRILTVMGSTMPNFWIGMLLLYLFAIHMNLIPVIAGSNMLAIWVPAITLSLEHAAMYTRLLRSSLLDAMNSNYMKVARTKGLTRVGAMLRHGLKNAILPCLTLVATNFGGLLCGSFTVETIFSWNGIGMYAVQSVKAKDLPVIQGYMIAVAVSYIVINLLVDIIYVYVDPKIKLSGGNSNGKEKTTKKNAAAFSGR